MKPFSKNEIIGVTLILGAIILISYPNLRIALRRARDAQRRTDIDTLVSALEVYHRDFGFFPPSQDGKIKACKDENFDTQINEIKKEPLFFQERFFETLAPCDWGKDSLQDLFDPNYPAYLKTLPQDPKSLEGGFYLYLSNSQRFQIYTFLEGGKDEIGFSENIIRRNLSCGNQICNYGKAYGATPLDKSIEEYENELMEQQKSK